MKRIAGAVWTLAARCFVPAVTLAAGITVAAIAANYGPMQIQKYGSDIDNPGLFWTNIGGGTAGKLAVGSGLFSSGGNLNANIQGAWQRQGIVISPTLTVEGNSAEWDVSEPTVIGPEGGCVLLPSQYATCFKMIYTANASAPVLMYAEFADGLHNWIKSPTPVASAYRSSFWAESGGAVTGTISNGSLGAGTYLDVSATTAQITNGMFITSGASAGTQITGRVTGTGGVGRYTVNNSQNITLTGATAVVYYLIAPNANWSSIDLLVSATSAGPYSVLTSAFIPLGASGTWDAGAVTNTSMIFQNGTAYIYIEAFADHVTGNGGIGLLTSTDMATIAQPVPNPVVSGAGGAGVPSTTEIGGPAGPFFLNGQWCMWVHQSPFGHNLPTDLYSYCAPSLTAAAWTPTSNSPVLARLTTDEGVNTTVGQIADPSILQVGNKTYLWYSVDTDGTSPVSGNFQIKAATADMTLAQLIETQQGDNAGMLAANDNQPAALVTSFTAAGTYYLHFPAGAHAFRVTLRGGGGNGLPGIVCGTGNSCSSGGAGGGGTVRRTDWIPISRLGGVPTIILSARSATPGAAGALATFDMGQMDPLYAYGGGGGSVGIQGADSAGGGGGGTGANGGNASGNTPGSGGTFNGSQGGVGGSSAANTQTLAGGSGGGGSSYGASTAGNGGWALDGSQGAGGGGGCFGGTPFGGGGVQSSSGQVTNGGAAGGVTGSNGINGNQAISSGASGGTGGGAGHTTGGNGGNGGLGGGGGGSGGDACDTGGTAGTAGLGGAPTADVEVM